MRAIQSLALGIPMLLLVSCAEVRTVQPADEAVDPYVAATDSAATGPVTDEAMSASAETPEASDDPSPAAGAGPTTDLSFVTKLDIEAPLGIADAADDVAAVLDSVADESLTWSQLGEAVEAVSPEHQEQLAGLAVFAERLADAGAFSDPALLGAARGIGADASISRTDLQAMLRYMGSVARYLDSGS